MNPSRVLAVLCLLLPLIYSKIQLDDWHCGSEEMSRQVAYDEVMDNCPDFACEMNHCCVIHDECYVRQAGQKHCDDEFCACNRRALNRTGGRPCRPTADLVCIVMPFVGYIAYENSVNYTEPADMAKYVATPAWPAVHDSFDNLYASCNRVNSTLSSCALNQNECELNKQGNHTECAEQMCDCLRGAYAMDKDYAVDGYNSTCLSAVTHACREVILAATILEEEESRVWFRRNILSPYSLSVTVVAVAATCTCLLILWCVVQLWWRNTLDDKQKVKYTAVI